jgi:ribosomal 50S subunit-recycling heat shock protein
MFTRNRIEITGNITKAAETVKAGETRNVSKVDYSVQSVGGGGLEHREG